MLVLTSFHPFFGPKSFLDPFENEWLTDCFFFVIRREEIARLLLILRFFTIQRIWVVLGRVCYFQRCQIVVVLLVTVNC